MHLHLLSITKEPFLKNDRIFTYPFSNEKDLPEFATIIEPKFNEIGIEISSLNYNHIDKSKPWLVCVKLLPWKLEDFNFDIDILNTFDYQIQNELLNGQAYLLIDNSSESHTKIVFEWLHKFLKNTKLQANKIIYMCHAVDLDKHYDNFCKDNNIDTTNKCSTIFSGFSFSCFITERDIKYYQYDRTNPKNKTYLFLNRIDRPHRVCMVSMLSYYNLLEHGYVSLGAEPNVEDHNLDRDIRLRIGFEKVKHKFPLVLDTNNFQDNMVVGISTLSIEYYEKTYFSLVSSTWGFADQELATATNEKELKPMLAKQPFIIWGRPYALESMRDMGFMTFSKWFDESYDTETDDIKRMEKIALEVGRLASLTTEQWQKILKEMEPILLHNYNRLVNYFHDRYYFSSDLKNFLLYVA